MKRDDSNYEFIISLRSKDGHYKTEIKTDALWDDFGTFKDYDELPWSAFIDPFMKFLKAKGYNIDSEYFNFLINELISCGHFTNEEFEKLRDNGKIYTSDDLKVFLEENNFEN
ncbi:MAG: hypothetical protein HUJ68_03465 [Clostridia bacterium]|nr:hypothetical protein [Clostridia bacterium]